VTEQEKRAIQEFLAKQFERLLQGTGNSQEVRQIIVDYTIGYMGAAYKLVAQ